jgi:hypothetical protein
MGAGRALVTLTNEARLEFGLAHVPMVHREACQRCSQIPDLCVWKGELEGGALAFFFAPTQ